MNKKLFLLILLSSLVLISAYFFIRYTLKADGKQNDEKLSTETQKTDSSKTKQNSPADLRPLFIQYLQQLVAKTSNGIYDLYIDDMQVDILASTVVLNSVVIKPDKKRADSLYRLGLAPNETYALNFKKLEVIGINIDDAITSKTMDYKLVRLTNPVFEIFQRKNNSNGNSKENKEDFTQRFLKEMQKLSLQNLVIEGGIIIIQKEGGKENSLKNVSLSMKDILIDSTTRNNRERFFFAKEADLSFTNYKAVTGNGQYNLTIAKVNVQEPRQKVTLSNLSLSPPLSKEQFSKNQKFSKEYYRLSFPSVTITDVNWWNLINEEEVMAKEININSGKLFIYLDRSLPPKSKMGNFPVQLLMKLPTKVDIERMKITNLDLGYEEYNPVSKQNGTINMDNISLDIAGVSNIKNKNAKPVTIDGTAKFMGKIPVKANFVFSRTNYKSGRFTTSIISDEEFEGSLVNSFAMPLGLVKIDKGVVQKLVANLKGDQSGASGDVTLAYKDLKLVLLEKDKGEKKLDKKGVTTLFTNLFVLKKDNPKKGEELKKEQASFRRIPEGGFFMLVWKTILTGALKSVGAPTRIANKKVKTAP